ncbi:MAG: hypothetical protein R3176_10785, partial [Woeseiaceae bacterium]|nr:hypothetical protein [Woeseiaceae bacterium]
MTPRIRHIFLALAASTFAIAGTAQANLIEEGSSEQPFINGEIAFGGFNIKGVYGSADPTGGTSLSTATGIDFTSSNVTVLGGTGDFAGIPYGSPVTFNDITFNPSTPADPLWVIDLGEIMFQLSVHTFYIGAQNDTFLDLWGYGVVSGTGYQDTN